MSPRQSALIWRPVVIESSVANDNPRMPVEVSVFIVQGMEEPLPTVGVVSSMELGVDTGVEMPVGTRAMGVSRAADMGTRGAATAAEGFETPLPIKEASLRHSSLNCEDGDIGSNCSKWRSLHCKISINAVTLQILSGVGHDINPSRYSYFERG